MSEQPQLYLKEDEVEHVISALSGSTSARDLAEALGRSEAEVLEAVRSLRNEQRPPSEIDLLREQNALLQKQIDELKGKGSWREHRTKLRVLVMGSAFLLMLGVWTMFVLQRRAATVPTAETTVSAPMSVSDTPVNTFTPSPGSASSIAPSATR